MQQHKRRIDTVYFLLAIFCLAAAVLGTAVVPSVQGVTESGLALGVLLLVVGPAAFVFGVLTIKPLQEKPLVRFFLASVGYVFGVFSFLMLAVSTGRLQP